MIKEILEFSYKHNLGHIPSALSMSNYIPIVFKYIKQNDNIIIGKPFGSQTYYLTWKNLGWLDNIDNLHMGVKHDEIDFVDYSEETIGNALGVASGIEMANKKKTYVNISDACLQMGPTLEAIQFIGKHQQNIMVTIDYNNSQVTGECSDIIPIEPVFEFFNKNGWKVILEDHNDESLEDKIKRSYEYNKPVVLVIMTTKGYGVEQMKGKEWHYKKINSEMELQSLVQELQVI